MLKKIWVRLNWPINLIADKISARIGAELTWQGHWLLKTTIKIILNKNKLRLKPQLNQDFIILQDGRQAAIFLFMGKMVRISWEIAVVRIKDRSPLMNLAGIYQTVRLHGVSKKSLGLDLEKRDQWLQKT